MQDLHSYIPMDRRQALANKQTLPERASGSILFADISGFTPLTDALTKELGHTQGAEAITSQLNRFYTVLIAEVHRYRGSVIGFIGDAITCWFDDLDGLRATACALAMQEAMAQFKEVNTPGGSLISLAIKVAVVSGSVRRFVVGSPDIQLIDALAGQTLEKMARAEKNAKRGEVLIADDIANRFSERLAVTAWRSDSKSDWRFAVVSAVDHVSAAPWLELPEETVVEAKSWLLPPIYERLSGGQGHFLAELRPATALFLRFTGLDYDSDQAAGDKLDAYVRWVQGVLARYEGYLIQLTIGDKGSFLYAAFGAPIAHDDDPQRAVRAALALQNTPGDFSFISSVQLGLAHGQMRTGAYGSPARYTYGVIGDKTNLAARLMGAAGAGGILCDFDLYRHARQSIAFEALEPIRVKGKANLIRVYRPTSQPIQPAQQSTLVGREKEVTHISNALDSIQAGQSQLLIISGEAGIGKSRLVAELARLLRERGLTGLIGAGQSIEHQTAYRAWQDIFSSYFDIDEISDPVQRREQVQKLVQNVVPEQIERLPLLNDLLNLGFSENDLTASLDAKLRQRNLSLLLTSLLQAWAKERPLILVLEDAHWLDSLSWQLTQTVARSLSVSQEPIFLLLVTRPLEANKYGAQAVMAKLEKLELSNKLILESLSPTEIVKVVGNCLAVERLPEPIADLVRNKANGNPFFAEELIFALRDQGLITVTEDAHCLISGDVEQARKTWPDTLQGLILARIDRLPPQRQSILKVAAVIGRSFAITPLHYTLNQYTSLFEDVLQEGLQGLALADFTNLETLQPELTYIFKHIITQEVAYSTLLYAQRRQLHRTVAAWYEENFSDLTPYYPVLVHHYHEAQDIEKERYYTKVAGEQAAARFANVEAVQYLRRALDLTPPEALAFAYDLHLTLEAVYELQAEREQQNKELTILANLADSLADVKRQAEVSIRQAFYGYRINDYPATIQKAKIAIGLAQQARDNALEAAGYTRWGLALWKQGNYKESRHQLEQALRITNQKVDSAHSGSSKFKEIKALVLNGLGLLSDEEGDYPNALAYNSEALAIRREIGDRRGESNMLMNIGFVFYLQGEYGRAKVNYEQSLYINRTIGDQEAMAIALLNLGMAVQQQGDYAQTKQLYSESLTIARETGDQMRVGLALANMSVLFHHLGDDETARQLSIEALTIAEKIGTLYYKAYALTHLAHALVGLADREGATTTYQRALTLREQEGQTHRRLDPLAGLARVALIEGNPVAMTYIEEILDHVETNPTLEGTYEPVPVLLTCVRVLQAHQDPRAKQVLSHSYKLLMERAAKINEPKIKRMFLENVKAHREIVAEWAKQE